MQNKTKLTLGLAGAAGAAALAAWGLGDYILRCAIDREQPRSLSALMNLMQGLKPRDDPYAGLEAGWQEMKERPHETVTITARDGVELAGHWFYNPRAERVLLAVHGWRSAWYRDFGASFAFYRDHGCSVLYIEQRGQGHSGGEHLGFGMAERLDLPDWLAWIVKRCGEEIPIYLAGISMGASTVLMAADLALPGNVRGIMADCGYTSLDAILRHVIGDNMHLPYALLRPGMDILCRRRTGFGLGAVSTVAALRNTRLPVLLVHGEADGFVPPQMSWENFAACGGPRRILTVPGARHGLSYIAGREAYERMILAFWREFDA